MPLPRLRLRSMRARMTGLFALCTILVLLSGGAAVIAHEYRVAEERTREVLKVAAERARDETDEDEHRGRTLEQVIRSDQAEIAAGGLVLFVTDAQGKLLWRSRKVDLPLSPREWRTRGLWYRHQQLILARSWEPVEAELRETGMALAGLGTFLVLAAALGVWFIVGKTLSPIDALTAQAQSASVKELSVQLKAPSADWEMVRLAATLNTLLERLEREARSRGRFYLAASHELRTPLQALLGNLDVALSRARDARDYRQALEEAQRQTERLTRLVQDLLQLNALEMRASSPLAERVNVADLVERGLDTLAALIRVRGLQLDTRLPDVEIEAPPMHVEILLRNLLENAVKYATPGSFPLIELESGANGVQLRIFNECANPVTDTASWFEAFYRPDDSRNSQTGGNGLGLAIVAAVARDNDWDVRLQAQNGGVLARVTWPPVAYRNGANGNAALNGTSSAAVGAR